MTMMIQLRHSSNFSSTDLECNSNNVIDVVVPIEGQTYKFDCKIFCGCNLDN